MTESNTSPAATELPSRSAGTGPRALVAEGDHRQPERQPIEGDRPPNRTRQRRGGKLALLRPASRTGATPQSQGSEHSGDRLQETLLQGVSRTFALTIPQLPDPLRRVVGNAYLLCRIADTIEDEPKLDLAAKIRYQAIFLAALRTGRGAGFFARSLHSELSSATPPAEHELILATPRVLRITAAFNPVQRGAIARSVAVMGRGMCTFDEAQGGHGLADEAELDRYCYTVAGVVGEMLTDLFCDYSANIAARRDELEPRAIRFGRGLQMTNILKDIWEDLEHGRCWLPQDVFARHGYDLRHLASGDHGGAGAAFAAGLRHLIGVAHGDLIEALRYALAIPPSETGVRKFLVWAVLLAALTLRNLNSRPLFFDATQVKVPHRSVAATVVASRAVIRSRLGLTALFRVATRGLPMPAEAQSLRQSVVRPALSSG